MKRNPRKPLPPMPPDAPHFAPPPPRPRPPYCPPPIPSVLEGQSVYEALNILNQRVNAMSGVYNDVIAHCYEALHNLERAAEENGAYYGDGEVWVEEGYLPDENCTYKLVHKAVVDRHGEPIRIKLHLAYGNTTNSMIEQSIFSASQVEFADKMFVAIPLSDTGWYGNAIFNHSPIKSAPAPQLWTVGFTERGFMKVYSNGQSVDTMLRDTIVDAMGCSGVVILNGQLTAESYTENIPNATEQTERVLMGQNYDTGEVIWLVTGNENNVNHAGITTKAAAQILLSYGCDIAVELCEGANAGATDKGGLMFVPKDNEVPQAYAFWYITRKHFYKNDYERELAALYQYYGENFWYMWLNKLSIKDVSDQLEALGQKIEDETARAMEAEENLQTNINSEVNRATFVENMLQENINKEVERATAAETAVTESVTAETERAEAAEKKLADDIAAETQRAVTAETMLQTNINNEVTRATAVEENLATEIQTNKEDIATLQQNLDAETHARTEADNTLHTEILTETGQRQAADLTLQQNINAEAAERAQTISDLDTKLTGQINEIATRVTTLETNVSQIQTLTESLTNQMSSLDATVATLHTSVSDMETTLNEVKKQNIETTALVHSLEDTINQLTSNPELLPYIAKENGTATGTTSFENINVSDNTTVNHLDVTGSAVVPDPTDAKDAANKAYVDGHVDHIEEELAGYLPLTGGTVTGNVTAGTDAKFVQETAPTADNDVVNKKYVDDLGKAAGDEIAGSYLSKADASTTYATKEELSTAETALQTNINSETNRATTAEGELQENINAAQEALETMIDGKVNKSGDMMTGALDMSNNKVTTVGTPTENGDATNKQYVDEADATIYGEIDKMLPKSGGTMTGVLLSNANYSGNNNAILTKSQLAVTFPQIGNGYNTPFYNLRFVLQNGNKSKVIFNQSELENCNIDYTYLYTGIINQNQDRIALIGNVNNFAVTATVNETISAGFTRIYADMYIDFGRILYKSPHFNYLLNLNKLRFNTDIALATISPIISYRIDEDSVNNVIACFRLEGIFNLTAPQTLNTISLSIA